MDIIVCRNKCFGDDSKLILEEISPFTPFKIRVESNVPTLLDLVPTCLVCFLSASLSYLIEHDLAELKYFDPCAERILLQKLTSKSAAASFSQRPAQSFESAVIKMDSMLPIASSSGQNLHMIPTGAFTEKTFIESPIESSSGQNLHMIPSGPLKSIACSPVKK